MYTLSFIFKRLLLLRLRLNILIFCRFYAEYIFLWIFLDFRACQWLHGEFQPGLKFQPSQPGWNFVAITWRTSARAEILASAPNMKLRAKSLRRINVMKILARFEQTGLGFSARAELRPGLNPSPCNRQFDFKRICFRSRAEVSTRLTGLKFHPGLKFAMQSGPKFTLYRDSSS